MTRMDIVTVFHNETNYRQYLDLQNTIAQFEVKGGWRMVGVDNRVDNRGFAKGCNFGAFDPVATSPVIGFINPDCVIRAAFMDSVMMALRQPDVVICGNRYGKPQRELDIWGVHDWVCGAAFFVRRDFFTSVGGFDERFIWSHEETDLIRQAERAGKRVLDIGLPIDHDSPAEDSPDDAYFKQKYFARAAQAYVDKWKGQR